VPDLASLGAVALREAYRTREVSPVEVVDGLAARIAELDPELGAYATLCLERAREEAHEAEAAYGRGETGRSLLGVPLGVKDLFDSAGVRTTYGSPMFADHVPTDDAAALHRAREAGAILIGKTQTHEFAWGITSVNRLMGTSRNPWAPDRVSGGSSGGSAVALAARFVPLALGSDTGGSIRVPSAFCGMVGLKPTYGRVSAAGVFPLARSLDHPGPMARTPADAALLLAAIAGADPDDPATSAQPAGGLDANLGHGLSDLRVGVCPDLHLVRLADDVQHAFDATIAVLSDLGVELTEVALPEAELAYPAFVTIQRAEALHTHTRAGLYPERADEYGPDVRGRLEAALGVTLSDYLAASADRERVRGGFARVFQQADLLVTPVAACSPVPIGEERVVHHGCERDFRELVMSYTVPQDLTGLPACTVRAGFDSLDVPVGVQFTGPPWSETHVLRAAQAVYTATPDVQQRLPPSAVTA
jgi:aspartyl-tRNA(Asn)/glutamyl-tRNA(Gln) amidotransferase subunit A